MSKLVTIIGGSGMVGRYVARRMAQAGWRVRVAARRPNEAGFVRTAGTVGQVVPVLCNIRDDASVAAALAGADAVVNCVGALAEEGKNSFDALHAEGAGRVARLAAAEGISTMVHVSAIGADLDGESNYARTKAEGEAAVLAHMPNAMILRPSVIFGAEDAFFNRFAALARISPIVPLFGGATQFQPVWVDDVARAAELGATQGISGVFSLGGPDVESFADLMGRMLDVIQRRRLVMSFPLWLGRIKGSVFDFLHWITLGLAPRLITHDQAVNLANDNIVPEGAQGFDALGFQPVSMASVLPEYLWCYRPSGQYAAIKDSAKNL